MEDVKKILIGNGDPKMGLVYKVACVEEDILRMKGTLFVLEKNSEENNKILKSLAAKNGAVPGRTVLGLNPDLRARMWMTLGKTVNIVGTAALVYLGLS